MFKIILMVALSLAFTSAHAKGRSLKQNEISSMKSLKEQGLSKKNLEALKLTEKQIISLKEIDALLSKRIKEQRRNPEELNKAVALAKKMSTILRNANRVNRSLSNLQGASKDVVKLEELRDLLIHLATTQVRDALDNLTGLTQEGGNPGRVVIEKGLAIIKAQIPRRSSLTEKDAVNIIKDLAEEGIALEAIRVRCQRA